jgi:hypothetical protein
LLQRLLGCEGVKLEFTAEAIQEIAAMAEQINKEVCAGCAAIACVGGVSPGSVRTTSSGIWLGGARQLRAHPWRLSSGLTCVNVTSSYECIADRVKA